MKLWYTLIFCVLACFSGFDANASTLCIQPIGEFQEVHINSIRDAIEDFYGFKTEVLGPLEVPSEAYVPERDRYRSEMLLPFINKHTPLSCDYVLGFTNMDIAKKTPESDAFGVIGIAELYGRAGIVSTKRIRLKSGKSIERYVIKTSLHEVAHVLGAEHILGDSCLMAEWKSHHNHETFEICDETRSFVEKTLGHSIP